MDSLSAIPMHIGIDASRLAVAMPTGTERYSYELIGALARLERHHRWTLYTNGVPARLPPLGTNVQLRSLSFPRLWTYIRLSAEMATHPPDVLFVPAHVIPPCHPPRSIVTIHDLGYLAYPEAHPFARRLELHFTTWWSVRAASHIIAVSHATRADLIACYRVPPRNITVIHHGISSHFRPIDDPTTIAAIKARYHINPHDNYLLALGTVHPRKNLARLIDAFAHYVQRHRRQTGQFPRVQLVIAGKLGWLTNIIAQRAARADIADHVRFAGYVADEDLPGLLSGATALLFPSLYEGFGFPVLEALACGTPVLTSTTASLPEVAGDVALLVNPHDTIAIADGIAELVDDSAQRAQLQEAGLRHAARFTWERCAQETLGVLLCNHAHENHEQPGAPK